MPECPYCGAEGFIAKPYPEEFKCAHCGARFYGQENPVNLLKCSNPNCLREWIYKGARRYPKYTSCPDCKSSVRCPIA